jgi:[ribosomal protein S5]-alanine N-acetyltransferase
VKEVVDPHVPDIRSNRLELVSMSRELMTAFLDGRRDEARRLLDADVPEDWPDEYDARLLRMRVEQLAREPEVREWLIRAIVLREREAVLVGHAGFHGAPGVNGPGTTGALEVGYTIFPLYRGRGYATEVAEALMLWARGQHGVRHFIASVRPENTPSLAVLRKLGFGQTGEQWDDEDGFELVYERFVD